MRILTFTEIVDYVGDFSRPLREGSIAIDNIITFGILKNEGNVRQFFALCMSLTDPKKKPYEVTATFNEEGLMCSCSCIADKIGHCKHVVGFLMLLERTSLEDVEAISKTDLSQSWGRVAETTAERCKPSKVMKLCHVSEVVQKYAPIVIHRELQENVFIELRKIFPRSGWTEMYNSVDKKRKLRVSENEPADIGRIVSLPQPQLSTDVITFEALPNDLVEGLIKGELKGIDDALMAFSQYHLNKDISTKKYYDRPAEELIDVCLSTVDQSSGPSSQMWKEERKKRITGYKCYEFHTYYENDHPDDAWEKKISSVVHSSFTSEDMDYGSRNEVVALKLFQDSIPGTLFRCGFVVNQHLPCLGYSPDCFLVDNIDLRLVEVKCPKAGRTMNHDELIEACKYVKMNEEGELELRPKHIYYGQVQLGMLLTNTSECHFLIYHEKETKVVEILVPRNEAFQRKLSTNLVHVYFKHYLPYIKKYYRF